MHLHKLHLTFYQVGITPAIHIVHSIVSITTERQIGYAEMAFTINIQSITYYIFVLKLLSNLNQSMKKMQTSEPTKYSNQKSQA